MNPATKTAVASLERVRVDLAKFSQMTPAPADAAAYRAKLTELQAEEHRLVHEIGGQLAALDRDEPRVEIDAIRKNIPADGVLEDIARFGVFDFKAAGTDDKWQPPRYAAWVVPPAGNGDVTIVDLGPAEEIDATVKAYREAIDAVQKGGFARGQSTAEDELKITAAPLTTKALQPIIAAIGDATDIILSPTNRAPARRAWARC